MSTSVTWSGSSYTIPAVGDASWGNTVSSYLIALASSSPTGALARTGGAFTLTNDVLFGGTYGLQAVYYKSNSASIAASGVLRLAKGDIVAWRNNAGTADLALGVNVSDQFTFGSSLVLVPSNGLGTVTNADVSSAAAIAYSKLNLATSIVNADVSAAAAIAYSKLNLAGAVKLASDVTGLLPAANGGTGVLSTATFPTSGVVVTEAGTETLTNKTLTAPVISSIVNTGTLTLPTSTDTLVGRATTDTLTNKTLTAPVIASIVNTGTLTLPTSTDTLVGRATTDTLTNKTLTSPTLATPLLSSYLDITEITTPTAPAASKLRLYSKTGDGLYFQGNATTETQLQAVTSKLTNFNSLADGSSGQVLTTLGSGTGYQWAAALTTTLNQYNLTVGNASNIATSTNTNLLGSITAQTASQTATITIATPGVLTVTTAPATGATVYLTTTGALPTGLTANTTYYAIHVSSTTLQLASTLGNALAGTAIATSGTQSGTHTMLTGGLVVGANGLPGNTMGVAIASGYVGQTITQTSPGTGISSSGVVTNIIGPYTVPAGVWMVTGNVYASLSAAGTLTGVACGLSTTSGGFDNPAYATFLSSGFATTAADFNVGMPPRVIVSSGSTSLYLVGRLTYTGTYTGNWTSTSGFTLTRIA